MIMKTIISKYFGLALLVVLALASCSKELETNPTDRVSGPTIFANEQAAQTAMDGSYYLLYQGVYVSSNANHAEGHQSTILAQDLMGDDMIITVENNWYGMDYTLDYTRRINIGTASRNYNIWNMMYTIISNMNYIIAQDGNLGQNGNEAKNIVAQAYALRSFAYFELIQDFQRTYVGHEGDYGVPLYTDPTRSGTDGKPRGTVEDVYTLINADILRALELFTEAGKTVQKHCSHIDYYVTKAFQARVGLVQGKDMNAVYNAAAEARSRAGIRLLTASEITGGMNDYKLPSSIWAMEVIPDQATIWYYYLDARGDNGGKIQRKLISKWLYDQLARYTDDKRLAWWKDGNQGNATTGENVNHGQMKFLYKDLASHSGDNIFIRAEEMLLIQAEAKARLGEYAAARTLLKELAAVRLTTPAGRANYGTYVDGLADSNILPEFTTVVPTNVYEEVLVQRRIELWGEVGRTKDLLRLKQSYTRDYPGTNHGNKLLPYNTGAESWNFIFKIPQKEFDGNPNIPSSQQNPVGQ